MSESHQEVEAKEQEVAETNTQEIDNVAEKSEQVETAQDVSKRLIEESNFNKKRAKQEKAERLKLEKELAAFKEAQMQKEATAEEKAAYWEKQAKESEARVKSMLENKTEQDLFSKVAKIATDCKNISLLLHNPEHAEDVNAAVDWETGEINDEILQRVYEKDKAKNPYLYNIAGIPKEVSGQPQKAQPPQQKAYAKMSQDEKTALKSKLIKQKYG
jgi:hypothetical protein